MIIGLFLGYYFMPEQHQDSLDLFRIWVLPLIEISILTIVSFKLYSALQSYKKLKSNTPDFYDTLKKVCAEIVPKKLVLPLAMEIAVIYYGFIRWGKHRVQANEFTYHKKSGTPTLLGLFLFLIVIEAFVLHLLLIRWSSVAAWIFIGLSAYTAIQVVGILRSLSQRPIVLEKSSLRLRYGIMNETQIVYSDIASVLLSKKRLKNDPLTKTLSPLGELERHNVIIHLKRENTLIGLYGFKKKYKVIALHIDDPEAFKRKLHTFL